MANVGVVLQAVTPFKALFKHTHTEKKDPGRVQVASKPRGLFADLETELTRNIGDNKQ